VATSALAAAAVAIPILLLGYTMGSHRAAFDSRILVPALGPLVIVLLVFEYAEFSKRLEDAHEAGLVPANLLMVSDVRWTHGGAAGRLSGQVYNRSGHELIGMSLEVTLYGGSEQLSSAVADTDLDVAPGQHGSFTAAMADLSAAARGELPCIRVENDPEPALREHRGMLQCVYRVTGTRGEDVIF
jgi:hypothetical protein